MVNRALVNLLHQVFGVVAGELDNLINFLITIRLKNNIFLFLYLFIYLFIYFSFSFFFFFYFFLFTVNFLGSYSFMRRSKSLGEFVLEIERFLHKRRREARNNNAITEEHTLKEYATPSTEEPLVIIVYLTVEGNNFEIKPAFIYLVQQNQFFGSLTEDPNLHVSNFSRFSGTLKANQ